MNRYATFAIMFPMLALIVFVAPETISHGEVPAYFWGSMTFVYVPAMPVAMISAGIDHSLAARPLYVRTLLTTVATGLLTASLISWLWGFLAGGFPLIMAALDGATPAAVCSVAANFAKGRT